MNKKFLASFFCAIMFLLIINTSFVTANSIQISEKEDKKEDTISEWISIGVFYDDGLPLIMNVQGAKVKIEDLDGILVKTKYTNVFGNVMFMTGIIMGHRYKITVSSGLRFTHTTETRTIEPTGFDHENIEVFNLKSRPKDVSYFLIKNKCLMTYLLNFSNIFEKFSVYLNNFDINLRFFYKSF